MDRMEFSRLLEQGKIPSVLLFEGPEEHMKKSALQALRSALLPAGMEELNESILEDPEPDAILAAAETLPFLADRRLVLVRDYAPLVGRAEADDRLLSYLPSVPPSAVLLFYCAQDPNRKKKLYTAVKKLGGVVEFKKLQDRELTTFVTRAFHDLGRECDARTADFLIFTCGNDTTLLLNEVAKIASYHPEEPAVRAEDVRALATHSTEAVVFSAVDAVVAGDSVRAFTLLRNLLQNGESRLGILAMLLREYRLLQHIKIMQYEKKSVSEIRSALGVPSFAADQYLRQAKSYTGGQVKQAVAICLDTEYAVKSGKLNEAGALETAMLKLLALRGAEK